MMGSQRKANESQNATFGDPMVSGVDTLIMCYKNHKEPYQVIKKTR